MSTCKTPSCSEVCRACELLGTVAKPSGLDAADGMLTGLVRATLAMSRGEGPLSRLHLCEAHEKFVVALAAQSGFLVVIGSHAPVNTVAARSVN